MAGAAGTRGTGAGTDMRALSAPKRERSGRASDDAARGLDDRALVARARAGDDGAFDQLVRRHFERVYALLFRMIGNHEDAEDLAQECFARAHRALPHFRGDAKLTTWLHRIALHIARDHRRASLRRSDALRPGGDAEVVEAREGHGPEEVAALSELSVGVRAGLDRLPWRLRAALVLRTLEDKEYEEVAETLGITVGTARVHVMKARRLLLRFLAPWTERRTP